jgi:hypothetical protein
MSGYVVNSKIFVYSKQNKYEVIYTQVIHIRLNIPIRAFWSPSKRNLLYLYFFFQGE